MSFPQNTLRFHWFLPRILLASTLILLSCSLKRRDNQSFIYCSEGSPSSFNPQIFTDGTSNNASSHTIFERLVAFKYGSVEIIPSLAESFDISEDRLTYTFHLRKDVPFHANDRFTPTRLFNSKDVLFSINRMLNKDHPYHKVSGGSYEYFVAMGMNKAIRSLKAPDLYTVVMTLSSPDASFLANLAMPFMSIHSQEYAEALLKNKEQERIDQYPIGTGPFVFKNYSKDSVIRYKVNPDYWGEKPSLKRMAFSITTDASVRFQKLKTMECHFINSPSPADLEAIKREPHLKLEEGFGLNIGYLAMNTEKKPFDNPKVRRAISLALNKKSYIKAIYLDQAIPAKNPLPPTIWSYHDELKELEYNPQKAKALLIEAGLPQGFSAELWTLPVSRPYNPNGKKMGEMMQADLKKVGIDIKLVSYEWPTYLKKTSQGEHQMVQLGWSGDNGDPSNFLNVLLSCDGVTSGSNSARWCHPQFDQLLKDALLTSDIKERTRLYKRAQEIFREELPWVPLAHSKVFRAMNKKVQGYKMDPLGGDIFRTISLQKDSTQ